MKYMATVLFFVTVALMYGEVDTFSLAPLYGYYNVNYYNHYYTTNLNIIKVSLPGDLGSHWYRSEGIVALLENKPSDSAAVPLHHYYKRPHEHLYTTNKTEVKYQKDYKYREVTGYCYSLQVPHTIPLYRYKKQLKKGLDHFYDTDVNEIGVLTPGKIGSKGYIYVGIACFVYKFSDKIAKIDKEIDL